MNINKLNLRSKNIIKIIITFLLLFIFEINFYKSFI